MSGGVSINDLSSTLSSTFSPTKLIVDDMSDGCGAKFDLIIVSDKFTGVSLLDRQRQVNEAIKPYIHKIHAVTMKCLTPSQWESRKNDILAEKQQQ